MELRKDYILDRWAIIAEGRKKRPEDLVNKENKNKKESSCPFCAGNESQTLKETYKLEKDGNWKIRVVPNKFSAVDPNGDTTIRTHNSYYTFAGDHGTHEVVIETPQHNKNFGDLTIEEISDVLKACSLRINELEKIPLTKYVCVFKNQGKDAGASLKHAHSQIVSLSIIPPTMIEKLETIKKFSFCPYCDIISKEKDSYRRCFENDSCISFTSYAPRFNYEVLMFPKNHIRSFKDFNEKTYIDFASMLKSILKKLEDINAPYDLAWYYSPEDENLHFHLEIMPRLNILAGFELGFGININTVSPEEAAKFYRGKS